MGDPRALPAPPAAPCARGGVQAAPSPHGGHGAELCPVHCLQPPPLPRASQADYELSPDEKRKEMGEEIIRRFLKQEVSPGGASPPLPRQPEQEGVRVGWEQGQRQGGPSAAVELRPRSPGIPVAPMAQPG